MTTADPETLRARVAEIARGLSEAQRKVLMPLSRDWIAREGKNLHANRKLYELGLVECKRVEGMYPLARIANRRAGIAERLTDAGIAVREYLQGNPHDD